MSSPPQGGEHSPLRRIFTLLIYFYITKNILNNKWESACVLPSPRWGTFAVTQHFPLPLHKKKPYKGYPLHGFSYRLNGIYFFFHRAITLFFYAHEHKHYRYRHCQSTEHIKHRHHSFPYYYAKAAPNALQASTASSSGAS